VPTRRAFAGSPSILLFIIVDTTRLDSLDQVFASCESSTGRTRTWGGLLCVLNFGQRARLRNMVRANSIPQDRRTPAGALCGHCFFLRLETFDTAHSWGSSAILFMLGWTSASSGGHEACCRAFMCAARTTVASSTRKGDQEEHLLQASLAVGLVSTYEAPKSSPAPSRIVSCRRFEGV